MKKIYLIALVFSLSLLQAAAQCTSTCTYIASEQGIGSTSAVTILKPTGVVANDVMIAAIHSGWCGANSITPPAGWTLINSTSNTGPGCGSSSTQILLATYYRVATASEPSAYVFTGSATQYLVGGIVAYTGVNPSSPINATSSFGAQEACANIVANSVTTTVACTRLVSVFVCSVNSSATNIIPQVSLTERLDVGTTGNHPWGNENLEISDESILAAGATGNRTAALSGCSGLSWATAGQLIALECQTTTGINDVTLNNSFMVTPNPTSGIFEIALNKNAPKCKMEIYDGLGRIIKQAEIQEMKTVVDLSSFPKGIYSVKLVSEEGTMVKKIVIE